MFDILIMNGTIVDGTGNKRFKGSIGIKDGKIEFAGSGCKKEAKEIIEAEGLVVTPGFIDFHSHSDFVILAESRAMNTLKQGITTEITGHCGVSAVPLTEEMLGSLKEMASGEEYEELSKMPGSSKDVLEYINKRPLGTNVAFLCGHGTIRSIVMGYENRKPTEAELDEMKALVGQAMKAGALGMSTGLIYPPGVYADEEEIVELCKVVAEYGGIYASHMRSESKNVVESVKETIRVAEITGIPVVISHHKIAGKDNWGKSKETLKSVEEANARGLKVRLDQYPYQAGATDLINALPPKFAVDGKEKLLEKLKDKNIRNEMKELLSDKEADFENLIYGAGLDGVLIGDVAGAPELCGKTVAKIAEELNKDPYDVIFDLLLESKGSVGAAYFLMGEEDIERIMAYKYTMGGTDSCYVNESMPAGHPRFTGTFTRILSEYIRDRGIVGLEEGIRKMTSMAADMAGFKYKGVIKEGYDADIVIFDYDNLKVNSDFINPDAPNEGVKYVIVNGEIAVKDDAVTGALAGRVLLR